jgi:hypothetical protein
MAVIRSMSLNQMASDPRTVNGYARTAIDAGKTLESFSDNDLIAMPRTN